MARRLAAILATDVVGYSSLMAEDEAGTLAALRAHRQELFNPETEKRSGRIVKLMGDGALVEFPSVVDAVQCAVAIQTKLTETGGLIRLRIGINLGDVIIDGDDIYGEGVNVAARLEALAEPGGICISSVVQESVGNRVEAEFADAGEHEIKGLPRPIRVWRWPADQDRAQTGIAPHARPEKSSIAVLPFDNLSTDPDQEFFADGITEDVITELSRFSGLFVIARNSSFAYKGQPVNVTRVAGELGVRYLLEGSVRRAGKRLRITAQLLDSVGGGHVWAEKYDCDLEDVFDLQDEITRKVVGSIAPQIELAELERSRKLSGPGLTAYELALKAQAFTYDALRAADPMILDQAYSAADAALAMDPRNIHALWTKCLVHLYRHMYRWGDAPDISLASAGETAERLIRTDSLNAQAYMARAWVFMYGRKFDAALADHHRALDLNPNLALNLFAMAWTEAVSGLAAEAREHVQLALRLSPRESDIWQGEGYAALALASFIEGDYSEAVKWGHLAYQLQPVLKGLMVAANALQGDLDAAKSHAMVLKDFAPDFLAAVLSGQVEVFKLPEHNELFIEGLREADLPE
jgi:TolB-like protein